MSIHQVKPVCTSYLIDLNIEFYLVKLKKIENTFENIKQIGPLNVLSDKTWIEYKLAIAQFARD